MSAPFDRFHNTTEVVCLEDDVGCFLSYIGSANTLATSKKACVTLKHEYLEVFLEYYRGQSFGDFPKRLLPLIAEKVVEMKLVPKRYLTKNDGGTEN